MDGWSRQDTVLKIQKLLVFNGYKLTSEYASFPTRALHFIQDKNIENFPDSTLQVATVMSKIRDCSQIIESKETRYKFAKAILNI